MFDDSLDVIDFCPSNNTAVVYVSEADLVADCAYRRRVVRLRKVTVSCWIDWLNFLCFKVKKKSWICIAHRLETTSNALPFPVSRR